MTESDDHLRGRLLYVTLEIRQRAGSQLFGEIMTSSGIALDAIAERYGLRRRHRASTEPLPGRIAAEAYDWRFDE